MCRCHHKYFCKFKLPNAFSPSDMDESMYRNT